MNIGEVAEEIRRRRPDETLLTKIVGGKGFYCLDCPNGTGKDKTGAVIYYNKHTSREEFHCPKCGKNYNALQLFARVYGYDLDDKRQFVQCVKHAAQSYGIALDVDNPYRNFVRVDRPAPAKIVSPSIAKPARSDEELALIRADIAAARDNLDNIPPEFMRALKFDTLYFFGCGWLDHWTHPACRLKNLKVPPSPRLIVPCGVHYNAILPEKFRATADKKYWKMHAGDMFTFGLDTITSRTERVLAFEGEVDAMSAWQAYDERKWLLDSMAIFQSPMAENLGTGKTIFATNLPPTAFIATLGAGRNGWMQDLDAVLKALGIKPLIVIMFDDNDAGRLNAPKRQRELYNLGYTAAIKFLKGA